MPSEKILNQKKQEVQVLTDKVKGSVAGVLVNYYKTTVEDDTKLRKSLREANVDYAVVKNSILRFVFENTGYEALNANLEGMTAFAISENDPVAAAKILSEFAQSHKEFEIKAGFVDGKAIGAAEVDELAKLPSKEVLIAKVLGGLNSPICGLANVLNGNIRGLACVLSAIADKKNEA